MGAAGGVTTTRGMVQGVPRMEPPEPAEVPALAGCSSSNDGLAVLHPDRSGLARRRVLEVERDAAGGALAVAHDRVGPAGDDHDLVEPVDARQGVLHDHAPA